MGTPILGQINFVGFNFASRGFHLCDGSLQAISANSALFSLLGTIYGGDGRTTYGLPDMRGRTPLHRGNGTGLPNYPQGSKAGNQYYNLTTLNLPSHTHTLTPTLEAGTGVIAGDYIADGNAYTAAGGGADVSGLAGGSVGLTGGSQNIYNLQPFLGINVVIATAGLYPSRN